MVNAVGLFFIGMVFIYSNFVHGQIVTVNHGSTASGTTYTGCDFNYYYTGSAFPGSTGNSQNRIVNFQASSGTCLSVTFFVFSLENYPDCNDDGTANDPCDYLQIYTGLNASGTQIGGKYSGTNNPGFITSNTGILSFRFTSDVSFGGSGWYAKINCTCPSVSDAVSQDCSAALPFCSSVGGTGSSVTGSVSDLNGSNQGCLTSGEKYGAWYEIVIQNTGTMRFALDPATNHDYDYALWGPDKTCSSLGSPIRCSYSSPTGMITGMYTAADNFYGGVTGTSEDVTGNDWTTDLSVTTGETYLLFVGDYTGTAPISGFQMTLGGTAEFTCNTTLNVDLFDYDVRNFNGRNIVNWITSFEINSDYYKIDRSSTGMGDWEEKGRIQSVGYSTNLNSYNFEDNSYAEGINYYRVTQFDIDGIHEVLFIGSMDNRLKSPRIEIERINLTGQKVDESHKGLVIVRFSDGTSEKRVIN